MPEPESVTLLGDDVLLAQTAVRKYLTKLRNNYRNDLRKSDRGHFAATKLQRFDDYLDLYERLGGDPEDIPDLVVTPPASESQPTCDLPFGDGYTCDLPKGHS